MGGVPYRTAWVTNRRVASRSRFSETRTSDDPPELIDRPVRMDPPVSDLGVGLVDEPAIARGVPAGPSRVDHQWREPPHPAIDRDVINGDAPRSERLFHVSAGQTEARAPAHHQHDDLTGKPKPSETRPRRRHSTVTTTHQPSPPHPAIHQHNSASPTTANTDAPTRPSPPRSSNPPSTR